VIYFGTKRRYLDSGLAHHNIILGKRYNGLLDDIFNRQIVADDSSLYCTCPPSRSLDCARRLREFLRPSPVPHLDSGTDWAQQPNPTATAS